MNTITRLLATTTLCVLPAGADAAVIHQISKGVLTGASGVRVGQNIYDVSFSDGTCASVYGKCENDSLDFTTKDDAIAAGEALLNQVFVKATVDNVTYDFDENAKSTGCVETFVCTSRLIYAAGPSGNIEAIFIKNSATSSGTDTISTLSVDRDRNTGDYGTSNFVRFKLTGSITAAVPEPATWALMLAGFGLTGAALRRRRVRFAQVAG